jgi:LysR family transcriptional regulator, transcription activator of glutamate synthase operon
MNIEWMKCFIEVGKKKSISKASEALNLSQPAVSQQIKKLEDYFGVILFNRSSFGMELTDAGCILYDKFQFILKEIDNLSLELINYKTINKISIGTIPSVAMYYLPKKILKMRDEGMEVEVHVRNTSVEAFQLLESETVNLVLMENQGLHQTYWSTDLFTEDYYAVLPDSHALSRMGSLCLKDVKDEPLIVYPSSCDVRNAIIREFKQNDFQPKISMEVAFGESIFGFVLAEAGITIVPALVTKHTVHLPLSILPVTDFKKQRTISLVSRSKLVGEHVSKRLKWG